MIYIFIGDGKGKTSAALGMAVRAICAGLKVAWVAWYKEPTWPISEKKLPQMLPIDFYLMGKGFYIKSFKFQVSSFKLKNKTKPLRNGGIVVDKASLEEHKEAAKAALNCVLEILRKGEHNLLICDEINNALSDGLLTIKEVKRLLKSRGKTHLVLTGRKAIPEIIKEADLVSEIKKIKHPYDKGIKAVRGLDY
ncbi:hypothetical protein A2160_00980 [Candidatus Beckwithbacteria bacterium RBG_13_42_9]|uniref:Cob(I)yrinic acid a,c-diamide adenosyltransferase n=1 Tax=Candidatus Beckwithbacteria bacterium RBG_13_42_9 TaxID=1797457 RepID=A0A1F5E347_9BACT|nr:MAG: hypothetical protein A2160_00980 [Candidatus Beckwithbacteria bacterium RBG_13_42_9]